MGAEHPRPFGPEMTGCPREMDVLRRHAIVEIYLEHVSVGSYLRDPRPPQHWSKRDATIRQQALPAQFAHVDAISRQFFDCQTLSFVDERHGANSHNAA